MLATFDECLRSNINTLNTLRGGVFDTHPGYLCIYLSHSLSFSPFVLYLLQLVTDSGVLLAQVRGEFTTATTPEDDQHQSRCSVNAGGGVVRRPDDGGGWSRDVVVLPSHGVPYGDGGCGLPLETKLHFGSLDRITSSGSALSVATLSGNAYASSLKSLNVPPSVISSNLEFQPSTSYRTEIDPRKIGDTSASAVGQQCPSCSYTAPHLKSLKQHLKIHSGEKPFSCPFCDYRTCFQKNLKPHIQTHTGEKPFHCHICAYKANKKNNLVRHMSTVHKLTQDEATS